MKRSNIDAMICRQEKITDITRETINKIQLDKLNAVLKREKERQGFYRDLPERLESLDDLKTLPFTTESDLAQKGGRMLLCSQGEIQRIISEQTSGTTKSDIDGIIDYLAEANHDILVGFSEENRLKVQAVQGKPLHIERLLAWKKK